MFAATSPHPRALPRVNDLAGGRVDAGLDRSPGRGSQPLEPAADSLGRFVRPGSRLLAGGVGIRHSSAAGVHNHHIHPPGRDVPSVRVIWRFLP